MKHATKLSLVVGMCLCLPTFVQAEPRTFAVKSSSAKFISDAPLETMVGTTDRVSGTITVDLSDIRRTTGKLKVPVVSLDTDNDLRNEHLQGDGWLNAKKTPYLVFEITEVVLGRRSSAELEEGKETKVRVKGNFTAHGITRPVTADSKVTWSGNEIQVKADFPVVLTEHDISVPSIVRLKVANEIQVSVDLRGFAR